MDGLVRYNHHDGVARITMDDGKLNVMSLPMLQALHASFDRAKADGAVVLLESGREGIFTAGFDLKVFAANDPAASLAMVKAGAELALKVFSHPNPVVTVCRGHAYPMGAFLILASDFRLGLLGPYRIGFNEVAIGIPVPSFALELGRHRLAPAWLDRTAVTGEMCSMAEAERAGFLDRVLPADALEQACADVLAAAGQIHLPSHTIVKTRLRGGAMRHIRAAIDAELTLEVYQKRAVGDATVRLPNAGARALQA